MNYLIQPLRQADFSDFGDVIEHQGRERRHPLSIAFEPAFDDMRQAFWVSRFSEAATTPLTIARLERHPYSDQAFVPLRDTGFFVAVCPDTSTGAPDVDRMVAFVARPGQGVIYRRNVWHAPMAIVAAPAEFFVTMGMTAQAANDEFFQLEAAVTFEMERR